MESEVVNIIVWGHIFNLQRNLYTRDPLFKQPSLPPSLRPAWAVGGTTFPKGYTPTFQLTTSLRIFQIPLMVKMCQKMTD